MSVQTHEGVYPILYGAYDLPVGSRHSPGYLARPDQAGRFPPVLVAPEAGIHPFHKDLCRRLARHGHAAIAVDPASTGVRTVAFLHEAHEFVASSDITWAAHERAGIVGLGTGGHAGLVYGADHPNVRAVVLVSTPLLGPEELTNALPRLSVPVLGLYAVADANRSGLDGGRISQASFVVYRDVGGSFLDAGSVDYDAAAAGDAYGRMTEFLTDSLSPEQPDGID